MFSSYTSNNKGYEVQAKSMQGVVGWINAVYARQPGTVFNGLNPRQPEIYIWFLLKGSFKLLEGIRFLLRNIERFQYLCWLSIWRNIWTWAFHKIAVFSNLTRLCTPLVIVDTTASYVVKKKLRKQKKNLIKLKMVWKSCVSMVFALL